MRGEGALVAGGDGDQAALEGGEAGADLVLLDHGGEGGGERGALAEEGGDGGVAVLAGALVQGAEGERGGGSRRGGRSGAAPRGSARGKSSIGLAQAGGGDGELELGLRLGVEAGAVAGEGGVVDLGERDQVDGVGHGGLRGEMGARARARQKIASRHIGQLR